MKLERFEYGGPYLIGVTDIDQQHTRFFEIYNELADRIKESDSVPDAYIRKICNDLFIYTKYHFKEEHWIMATNEYQKIREHLDQHQHLIESLDRVRTQKTSVDDIVKAIKTFVDSWAEHILVMDRALGEFLKHKQG